MYQFLLNMWIMMKADEAYLEKMVDRKWITQDEKEMIMITPQHESGRLTR